eukprot:tig00000227_g19856.t2
MTVPAKLARPGLRSRDGGTAVPLKALLVTAVIDGYCCETTLRHIFKHEGHLPVEVVYRFQVPENASVSGFEARIGPAEITGRVGDANPDAAAAAAAAHATAAAMGALDGDCSDGFLTLDSGRLALAPNAEAIFTVSIVHELPPAGDGAARFALPSAALLPDEELEDAPVDVSVDLSFAAPLPLSIGAVRSPTHASQLAVIREGDITRVTIGPVVRAGGRAGAEALRGALAVEAPMDGPAAFLWSDAVDGKGPAALALSAAPSWPAMDPAELEVFFALDRALGRARLEQAKSAVRTAVRSLPHGAHFDILAFGSDVERLCAAGKPQALSDKALSHADKFLERVRPADCPGGADLWRGTAAALDCAGAPGRPRQRQVILVTSAKNEGSEEVVALVQSRAEETADRPPSPPQARVFAVGTCEPLAAALARAGAGFPEFVPEGARLEGPVLRQLRRCVAPGLGRLAADWGLPRTLQAPRELPSLLFAGDRLTAYAFGPPPGLPARAPNFVYARPPGRGSSRGGRIVAGRRGGPIAKLAARAAVRDSDPASPRAAARAAALSCRHGIASRGTPYAVALGGSGAAAADAGVALRVPCASRPAARTNPRRASFMRASLDGLRASFTNISLGPAPSNGAGSGRRGTTPDAQQAVPQPPTPAGDAEADASGLPGGLWRCICCSGLADLFAGGHGQPLRARGEAGGDSAELEELQPHPQPLAMARTSTCAAVDGEAARRPVDVLLHLQATPPRPPGGAGGLWELDAELAAALGRPLPALLSMRPKHAPSDHFATEQVLEYLETRCPELRDEWGLAAAKAAAASAAAAPAAKKGGYSAIGAGRPRSPWRAPGAEWSVANIVEHEGISSARFSNPQVDNMNCKRTTTTA